MPLEVPRERIIHETLGDEVVILDQVGLYYSLSGAGAEIWALLVGGVAPEDIAAQLERRFDAPLETMAAAVRALVDELVRNEILVLVPAASSAVVAPPPAPAAGPTAPWVAPRLERFDDLQALLVLDPIHDVDETGWPRKASDSQ